MNTTIPSVKKRQWTERFIVTKKFPLDYQSSTKIRSHAVNEKFKNNLRKWKELWNDEMTHDDVKKFDFCDCLLTEEKWTSITFPNFNRLWHQLYLHCDAKKSWEGAGSNTCWVVEGIMLGSCTQRWKMKFDLMKFLFAVLSCMKFHRILKICLCMLSLLTLTLHYYFVTSREGTSN